MNDIVVMRHRIIFTYSIGESRVQSSWFVQIIIPRTRPTCCYATKYGRIDSTRLVNNLLFIDDAAVDRQQLQQFPMKMCTM